MEQNQKREDIGAEFRTLEKSLQTQVSETFMKEGYSKTNQLQRILLEIIKEQIGYENTRRSTRAPR
jgi:hypothetical protein